MFYSVVIPVYNAALYLRDCLNSVINQVYKNFEVIVIDDGSTDSSSQIMDDFARIDPRVKVFHVQNKGVTRARQAGVSLAQGEYIIFMDSDDTINPDLLLRVNEIIEEFPNVEMIRYKCKMVNDKPGFNHELYNYIPEYKGICSGIEAIKRWTVPDYRYEVFWLYAIKKDKLSIFNTCPNLRTSEDYAFIPILIANCQKVTAIDYIGYNYLCNNQTSLTHENGYEKEKSREANFIQAYKYLISNMRLIEEKYNEDLHFFYDEWKQRLLKRYNKISEPLKTELEAEYKKALNQ